MKKITRRSFITVCGAAAAAMALTACGGAASSTVASSAAEPTSSSAAAETAAGTLSGNVATGGSTSMKNVIAALTEGFAEVEPGVTVSYDPTGSGAGITGATDKTLDIGLSSRALKDDEKNDVDGTTVALDGIAIIVNKDSKVADLTVDGSFGTGGAVCVMCLLSGQNIWVSLLAAVLAGLATGLVTGLLHTFMGIPAILSGILTQLALYSINLKIMGKANQSINVDKYDLLISLRWVKEFALHNPIIMVILVSAVVIAVLYWFFGTELGCAIRATGSNPAMSRAQGINTNFNIVLGLAVSNALVALSGALLSQYQGFADVGMGRGAIVIGLAAVIIGEAVFGRIFHNFALKMVSVSLGAIIYYIVIQLVLTLGFDANLLKLLSASVVAVFLAVPYWKGRYFAKPAAKKANKEGANNA